MRASGYRLDCVLRALMIPVDLQRLGGKGSSGMGQVRTCGADWAAAWV